MDVVVVGIGPQCACEDLGDVVARLVNRRAYDVARRLPVELLDSFAEVGLDDLDTGGVHIFLEAALIGEHGLRFDQGPRPLCLKDLVHNPIVFRGIACPVDVSPVCRGGRLELGKVSIEICQRVLFDVGRELP